jgi:hypothetical protein
MPLLDIFSKRKKREAAGRTPEVYQYEAIPRALRVQIVHIWRDAIGVPDRYGTDIAFRAWETIHDAMCREKGVFALSNTLTHSENCVEYLINATDIDDILDIVELSFQMIEFINLQNTAYNLQQSGIKMFADDAVNELNGRFREHGVGYQYEKGQIIRVDRQFVHSEVVKPALVLLHEPAFKAANADFMLAHDAVVAAQRAFEATLKAICDQLGVPVKAGDRVSELIKAVRSAGVFPDYLDAGFDTYVAMLKTGLPGVRNNAGGHGEAPKAPPVPGYIAAYAIHMAASNIVLCLEALKAARKQ